MDTLQILTNQLKKIPDLVDDDNQIKKNLVAHKINHNDPNLIDLIFDNTTLKAKFFQRVGRAYILKKDLLIEFILSKNYLPDSYTKYPNKIGLNLGSSPGRGSVVLDFPFKDCLLEGGQSKQESQRDEIFFNQILAQDEITQLREPKVLSCHPPPPR